MKSRGIGIIVWGGKAYIPSTVECFSGIVLQVDPVYECNLRVEEMVDTIQVVMSSNDKQAPIPDPTPDEWRKRKDPVLSATGAKSWRQLAQRGHSYGIGWLDQNIRLTFSRLDHQGRWEVDSDRTMYFPLNAPLQVVVRAVLDDLGIA